MGVPDLRPEPFKRIALNLPNQALFNIGAAAVRFAVFPRRLAAGAGKLEPKGAARKASFRSARQQPARRSSKRRQNRPHPARRSPYFSDRGKGSTAYKPAGSALLAILSCIAAAERGALLP